MVDGFLGRWSQRKTAARQEVAPPVQIRPATDPANDARRKLPAHGASPVDPSRPAPPGSVPVDASRGASDEPLPTLQDVAELTADSDFSPFMARAVTPQVRNAAMKKLFADPHFNVMDGLDTYIDDYSIPDPLPLAMLRKMASAKFMQLVDDADDPADPADAEVGSCTDSEQGDAPGLSAPTSACANPDGVAAMPLAPADPTDTDPSPPHA